MEDDFSSIVQENCVGSGGEESLKRFSSCCLTQLSDSRLEEVFSVCAHLFFCGLLLDSFAEEEVLQVNNHLFLMIKVKDKIKWGAATLLAWYTLEKEKLTSPAGLSLLLSQHLMCGCVGVGAPLNQG